MTFQNAPLELLDEGKSTERYHFQISRTKTVNMTGTIGDTKGTFECDYGATNLQAYLYTKMQRTYPDDTISVPNTANNVWPYGKSRHSLLYLTAVIDIGSCARRASSRRRRECARLHEVIRRESHQWYHRARCRQPVFMYV